MDDGFNIRDFLDVENMTQEEIDRCEFWTTANRLVPESGEHNFKKAQIQVNTNWNLDKLDEWLENYEDRKLIDFLRYGWPLNASEVSEQTQIPGNQNGANENKEKVREYLDKEIKAGSIIGPFLRNPFGKNARISPLDTRPKKNSEELRIILNLSHPFRGDSVNSKISKERFAEDEEMELSYPTVDDLAKIIRLKGRNAKIFIRDHS